MVTIERRIKMDSRTQYDFIRKTGTAVLLFLQLVLCPSCDSDIPHTEEGNKRVYTNILLSVTTRADAGSTDVQTEEGMKTLRVIAASSSGEVFDMHYADNMENNRTAYDFTMKLPVGEPIDFFAVANEMSVGADLSPYTKGSRLPKNFYARTVNAKNEGGTPAHYFPLFQKYIMERGLPITGRITRTIAAEGEKKITIPLTFAVAKIRIAFVNNSGYAFSLQSVTTGAFLPDKAYLFPQLPVGITDAATYYSPDNGVYFSDGNYFVPEGTYFESKGKDNAEFVDFTVLTGAQTSLIFYVYESYNPDKNNDASNYTLAFETNRNDHALETSKVFLNSPGIKRGTLLDITATIQSRGGYSLYWQVKQWHKEEIDVPAFD